MDKDKFTQKIKEGISMQEIENFVKTNTMAIFSIVAVFVAMISSNFHFFTGSTFSLLSLSIGAIVTVIFPVSLEKFLKMIFHFTSNQEKTTQMVLGGIKILIGLFLPFVYFAFLGIMAGSSYHYYIRHGQIVEANKK